MPPCAARSRVFLTKVLLEVSGEGAEINSSGHILGLVSRFGIRLYTEDGLVRAEQDNSPIRGLETGLNFLVSFGLRGGQIPMFRPYGRAYGPGMFPLKTPTWPQGTRADRSGPKAAGRA